MKWFDDWIEVFKTGTHTDSSGNERTWSQSDLDKIVASYSAQNEMVPVVLGHPKTDDPAYGWVSAIKREGDILLAKFERLCPEFINWVEKGLYRNISIALGADLSLRHIGFLGAAAPAVKGLENTFCDQDVSFFTSPFSASDKFGSCGVFASKTLTSPSSSSNVESSLLPSFSAFDKFFPPVQSKIASLRNGGDVQYAKQGSVPRFGFTFDKFGSCGVFASKTLTSPTSSSNAESSLLPSFSASDKFKERNMFKKPSTAEFSAKIEELETKLEFARKTAQRQLQSDFLANLQKNAKITAEDKVRLERVFDVLSTFGAEFSEAENPDTISFCDELKQVLTNLPQRVELSEIATSQNAPKGTYRTPQEELGMKIANSI